jgi:Ca2+-transporting ATPase
VQILWMNLVTDGLPALALGVEAAEKNVMARPPRPPSAPILGRRMIIHIAWVGLLMALVSLMVGCFSWEDPGMPIADPAATAADQEQAGVHAHERVTAAPWQTMLFTTMVFGQFFLALGVRSMRESLFRQGLFTNKAMIGAIGLSIVLHLGVLYVPLLQGFFKTVPLSAGQLGICAMASAVLLVAVELEKWIIRRRKLA